MVISVRGQQILLPCKYPAKLKAVAQKAKQMKGENHDES
jgi:hypothetical protein